MSPPKPPPVPRRIRVAFLEDYPAMRDSLAQLVRAHPRFELVGGWGKADDLLRGLEGHPADVVIMDLQLDNAMGGIAATAAVRQRFPSTMVLVLTLFEEPQVVFQALRSGAVGYLLKSAEPHAIVEAIEEVAAGGAPMTGTIARMVIERLQTLPEAPSTGLPPTDVLSRRENEVLAVLAAGYRYKEVADRLGVSHNTIRTHVRHIYEKLHVHGLQEAVNKSRRDRWTGLA